MYNKDFDQKYSFSSIEVEDKFCSYPETIRQKMMELREIILNIPLTNSKIGKLEETLKWNEPSYLTSQTKSGTTVRIDWKASNPERIYIYFNCKTTLVDTFKEIYSDHLKFEGNRSIYFSTEEQLPKDIIYDCVFLAFTYHTNKNRSNYA